MVISLTETDVPVRVWWNSVETELSMETDLMMYDGQLMMKTVMMVTM